jgi:hypothetical protein
MAINFPNSPSDGDLYSAVGRTWQYNSTASAWESISESNVTLTGLGLPNHNTLDINSSGQIGDHLIPDTNITRDLGTANNRWRDLYLSGNSIQLGTRQITQDNVPDVNLSIAPEVLEIQVDAPDAGQDIMWKWTWEQSTLPYARRTITNSNELNVPLYKEGTYVVNNFAAYDIHGSMTQTHSLYLKWIDGAGTDNLVSWATSAGPISDTHASINGGNATDVQRITVNVPSTITLPTLIAPSVSYTVTHNAASAYTFSGAASGDNPNLGPFYRGGTYTINITAGGHPFFFTTDNGTNFAPGAYYGEYTSGVTGSRTDNGTITFTVPADAPDTLYYQCNGHGPMRGAITIKNLAVETNINGNYVVYFQHTQEGHRTPVELRPIPSLVNQMCLVYDSSTNKFVPQDLATYVENTPSFENKIREVAGTAELVVADGSAVIAKVTVYDDSTYLPLTGNNAGDQAFATDTDILYIWDGNAWQQAGATNTNDLTEGATNLFFTNARADARIAAATTTDLTEGTNLYYTDARADARVALLVDSAPATLDTLNELAAALGDDPNFATTVTNSIATKLAISDFTSTANTWIGTKDTDALSEGSTNLYYSDARAQAAITGGTGLTNTSGTLNLDNTAVTAASYGSTTAIPVITVDAQGRITAAATASISTTWTISDGSNTQAIDAGNTLTVSGTGNEIEVAVSNTDTLTIGLPSDVTITNDLNVSGNLIVSGNQTVTGSTITDSNFTGLANGNASNAIDFGFYGKYVESTLTKYSGLFYDASSDNTFRLFSDTQTQPTTTIDLAATGFNYANLALGNLTLLSDTPKIMVSDDTKNLIISNNAQNSSSGVSIPMFGKDEAGGWAGDIHYITDSRGTSGMHRFFSWNGSAWAQHLTIDNTGYVGIGTPTPTSGLEISGTGNTSRIKLKDGPDQLNLGLWDGSTYRMEGDANRKILITSYHTDGVHIGNSGASNLVIKGGNIGVGTTLPETKLDIRSATATYLTVGNTTDNTSGLDTGIVFKQIGNIGNPATIQVIGNLSPTSSSAYTAGFKFKTGDWNGSAFSSVDAMTIAASGNIGIATATPNDKLHIASGYVRLQAANQTSGDHTQRVGIRWAQESDQEVAKIEVERPSWSGAPSNLKFSTRNTSNTTIERMDITHDGAINSLNGAYFNGYVTTSNVDGQNNQPFRLSQDYSSYMVSVAGNTWGLFWAGNDGARYGTNGLGGPGNIWSNTGNPNEFSFVGSDLTRWTLDGNTGNTWQNGTLTTVGNITSGGDVLSNSDARLKSNIRIIDNPRELIAGLSGKLYTKDSKNDQLGFIAQEVEEILPQLVHTEGDEMGTKSVNYLGVVALLVEAVKDLQQQVDELKLKLEN